MKISIITPAYNSVKTIKETIESVISQKYVNLEYIIIDGESNDGTLDIINEYKNNFPITLISEADDGIYDAMNKGVKIASGDIIGILNSDDILESDNILDKIVNYFQNDDSLDAVYGDIRYFNKNIKNITRIWKAGEYKESKLNNGWTIPHPSLYLKKTVYKKYGFFDTKLSLAADYELILRLLKVHKINIKYIPTYFVRMRSGGKSGKNIKQRIIGWKELRLAWKKNNLTLPNFFILRRIVFKLKQYF